MYELSRLELASQEVLVTGGAGFLGSHLVAALVRLGAKVTVLDDFSSGHSAYLNSTNASSKIGDVRNHDLVREVMKEKDVVFNLAARPFIPYCYANPIEVMDVNILGSAQVVLAAIEEKVQRFVHISSSEVYGSNHHEGMKESFATEPYSTYAVSKLAAERTAFTLSKEHGLPTTIIRPFNIYGPRDNHPRIVPTIISQLHRGDVVKLGNANTVRDLTYVEETAGGIVKLAMCDEAVGQITNLGSDRGYSPIELVNLISSLMDKKDIRIETDPSLIRPHDPGRMIADSAKAHALIGWSPKITIEEGLALTIDWYESHGGWSWEKVAEGPIAK